MTYPLFGFTGQTAQDPTLQAGLAQYMQQGQAGISPGQQQVTASDPIASLAHAGLGQALSQAAQPLSVPASDAMQRSTPLSTQQQMANLLAPRRAYGGITY